MSDKNTRYNLYQVLIGVLTLVATFLVIFQQSAQSRALDEVQIAVRDSEDIRNALSKPLEGIWKFTTDYSKFHDQEGAWESSGTAIMIWRPDDARYEIFFAASIVKQGQMTRPLVTYFAEGTILSKPNGLPPDPFNIVVEYGGRTGLEGFENSSYNTFEYEKCELVYSESGRVVEIRTSFESPKSKGDVVFTFERS